MRAKIEENSTFRTIMAVRVHTTNEPVAGSFRALAGLYSDKDAKILDLRFLNTHEMRYFADRLMNMAAEIDKIAVERMEHEYGLDNR